MGLFDRLAAAVGYEPKRDINDPRYWSEAIGATAAGIAVTERAVADMGLVQSIRGNIAGPISTLPLQVFERLADGNRRVASEHPLYTVLHRGAGRRTAQELREAMTYDLTFDRNCYAEIIPGDAVPVAGLDYIEPWRVQRIAETGDGRVYYRIAGRGTAPGYVLRDDEIWHTRRGPFTRDGLRGKPLWDSARETFAYALAIRQYGARWFKNSGRGGDILEAPSGSKFASLEEEAAFLDNWRNSAMGDNQHRVRFLKHGITRRVDVANNNEAQFNETAAAIATEICGLWSMPLSKVGLLDRAIKASVEQQSIDFVLYTLSPDIAAIEQAAERDLLVGPDRGRYYIEHNVSGLLRGDIKTRYAAYAAGRQWGWLSVNDIRRMENMDGIGAEGDRYLEPENMRGAGDREPPDDADPQERDTP